MNTSYPGFHTPSGANRQHRPRRQRVRSGTQRIATASANTQIICTIGPKSNSVAVLKELLLAGMNICRMNFSHGDHSYHQSIIDNVRQASKETELPVAIMLDTKGPEIRSGKMKDGKDVTLEAGQKFTFTTDQSVLGDNTRTSTSYLRMPQVVKPGDRILLGDGLIAFRVEKIEGQEIETTVLNAGNLGNTKGMNLPGCVVDLPAVTQKDKDDIAFGVKNDVDFIAASWIRKASDVEEIRNLEGVKEKRIMIISKIESQEGLDNFVSILAVSDGIMVARGDLGVEIPIERVANAQKMMIRECNQAGKPVVTATQMMESMIVNPRPTRAEATDVANAVFDGTDCVMLSGETANGAYPVECVKMMTKICIEAESVLDHRNIYLTIRLSEVAEGKDSSISETIASSAVKSCWDINANLIIVLSDTGNTVRFVSKYRPHTPILCITSTPKTARQVLVSRSTVALLVEDMHKTDELIKRAISYAKENGILKDGDYFLVTSGIIEAVSGSTNMLKIMKA
jgi:pyruvate kinase